MVPWKGFVQIPNLGHIFLFVPSFIFVVVHIQLSIILMVSSYCCHSAAVFWKQVQYLDMSLSLSICVWTQIAEWNYYLTCISDIIASADIVSYYIIMSLLIVYVLFQILLLCIYTWDLAVCNHFTTFCLFITASNGVVIATEKKLPSILVDDTFVCVTSSLSFASSLSQIASFVLLVNALKGPPIPNL